MTDISGYYIQQKGWYKVGAVRNQTVNDVWNDCHHIDSYRNVPDTLSLNRVFVVDMSSSQHSILPQDLRLHPAHEHRDSYNVVVRGEPHFQNHHYGEILEEYWGGDNKFKVPVGLWIYVIDEPTTVIYVKAVNSEFKFYYSQMGSEAPQSEISPLILEVDKQYTFRRVKDDSSHPFFLGDTDEITDPDEEGWRASASSNIEVTTPAGFATRTSGITTWESVGLRIDPTFIETPGNRLWYYCTTHPDMVFEFDVSGAIFAPTMTITVAGSQNSVLNDNASINLTFTTSEDVTGFTVDDIVLFKDDDTYSSSKLSNFGGGPRVYTATLNADGGGTGLSSWATYKVSVPASSFKSAATDLLNLVSSNELVWNKADTTNPSVSSFSVKGDVNDSVTNGATTKDNYLELTVNTNEPHYNRNISKMTSNQGTVETLTGDNGESSFTVKFTPTLAAYTPDNLCTINIEAGAFTDLRGLSNNANSFTWRKEKLTVAITALTSTYNTIASGSTTTDEYIFVEFKTSENTNELNLNSDDVTKTNCTLSEFNGNSGDKVYTAKLTPNAPGTQCEVSVPAGKFRSTTSPFYNVASDNGVSFKWTKEVPAPTVQDVRFGDVNAPNQYKYDGNTGMLSVENWIAGPTSFNQFIIKSVNNNELLTTIWEDLRGSGGITNGSVSTTFTVTDQGGGLGYTDGTQVGLSISSFGFLAGTSIKFALNGNTPIGGQQYNNTTSTINLIRIHNGETNWQPSSSALESLRSTFTSVGAKNINVGGISILPDSTTHSILFTNLSQ